MRHLYDYIEESIFSQTGIGDEEVVRRNLPLKILDCIISLLESSKYDISNVYMSGASSRSEDKRVKIELNLKLAYPPYTELIIQQRLYDDLSEQIKKDNILRKCVVFGDNVNMMRDIIDSERMKLTVFAIHEILYIEVVMDGKFLDKNRKDISTMLKRLKKKGWDGKIIEDHTR